MIVCFLFAVVVTFLAVSDASVAEVVSCVVSRAHATSALPRLVAVLVGFFFLCANELVVVLLILLSTILAVLISSTSERCAILSDYALFFIKRIRRASVHAEVFRAFLSRSNRDKAAILAAVR